MPQQNFDNLISHLEAYLWREGLYELIPEDHRHALIERRSWFRQEKARYALLLIFWLPATLTAFWYGGGGDWVFALTAPLVALFLIALLICLMLGSVWMYRSMSRRLVARHRPVKATELDSLLDEFGDVAGLLLGLGTPALVATGIYLYFRSWVPTVVYAVAYGVLLVVSFYLFDNKGSRIVYKFYLLSDLLYMALRVFRQMVRLLAALAPVLLVIVLFSIYSQEFWETLGNLTSWGLAASVTLLTLPAVAFVLLSIRREADDIVGKFPDNADGIFKIARSARFIVEKMRAGEIRPAELGRASRELEWRDVGRLESDVKPKIKKKTKRWLKLLFLLTFLFSALIFFAYFFVLFNALIKPSLVAEWMKVRVDEVFVPGIFSPLVDSRFPGLPRTAYPVGKVSLLLAVFIASMSGVYALNEGEIKEGFFRRLRQDAAEWLAVSCIYRNIMSPGYQVWEEVFRDRKKGVVNTSILVKPGLTDAEVEQVCGNMEERHTNYQVAFLVAFEKSADGWTTYRFGAPGACWLFFRDWRQRITFTALRNVAQSYADALNLKPAPDGPLPGDEWFGNAEGAVAWARAVMEADPGRSLVAHAYGFEIDSVVVLVVRLRHRMDGPGKYREYMRAALSRMPDSAQGADAVVVHLYYRDTYEELAYLFACAQTRHVVYKDAHDRRVRLLSRRSMMPSRPAPSAEGNGTGE